MNLLLASLLLLPQAAPAQDPGPKMDFVTTGSSVGSIVKELAKTTSLPLKVDAKTADEILVVRAKEVTRQDLLDRIAEAGGAKWDPETWTLKVDTEARNKKKGDILKAKIATFQSLIKKHSGILAKHKPLTKEGIDAQMKEMQEINSAFTSGAMPTEQQFDKAIEMMMQSPPMRLGASVISLIGAEALANIGDEDRVVFSTNANRMQRRLAPDVLALVRQTMADTEAAKAALSHIDRNDPNQSFILFMYGLETFGRENAKGPVVQVLVTVQGQPSFGGGLRMEVIGLNADGLVAFRQDVTQATVDLDRFRSALTAAQGPKTPADPNKPVVRLELSDRSKAFQRGLRTTMDWEARSSGEFPTRDADFEAILAQPEVHEPLSMSLGELMVQWADAKKVNVVARLNESPDMMMGMGMTGEDSGATIEQFELQVRTQHSLEEKDGWTKIEPAEPAREFGSYISRPALGKLVRAILAKGYASLPDRWTYCWEPNSSLNWGGIDFQYFQATPTVAEPWTLYSIGQQKLLYQFLSTLSNGQWQALRESKEISGFNPNQLAILSKQVYRMSDELHVQNDENEATALNARAEAIRQRMTADRASEEEIDKAVTQMYEQYYSQQSQLLKEPTLLLPNGLPNGVSLACTFSEEDALVCSEGPNQHAELLTADDFGTKRAWAEHPDGVKHSGYVMRFKRFQLAKKLNYNLSFKFGGGVTWTTQVQDFVYDPKSASYSFDQLPEAIRKKVLETEKSMREAFKEDRGPGQAIEYRTGAIRIP